MSSADVETGEAAPLTGGEAVPADEEGMLKPMPEGGSITEKAVAGTAAISVIVNVVSLILNAIVLNPIFLVSSLLGVAAGPFAAFQEQKITQAKALAETNEKFSEEVDHLKNENVRLTTQLESLGSSVKSLKKSKDSLQKLQTAKGAALDELQNQLEESKKIYAGMQKNLQGDILQNLISMALACDDDGDMMLDDDEIDQLIINLEGVQGVQLKEDSIRKMIVDNGRSLDAIMGIAKKMMESGDDDSGGGLFTFFEPEDEEE
eukprot:CAMPEP_0198110196 /NCGR_PEP_ID=MMETSP1442-20131203/2216_1 /TAXON_ID= /ORGANISM="Craspedostauros australis, Strain CCMP3328" /LENGTH=261 /DNA_ID=CAMNT_0043766153 /DNA_START=84 /DNA_END=869 /DNA_ORIENTATION=-